MKGLELLIEKSEDFSGIRENKSTVAVFDIYFKINGIPCSGITKINGRFVDSTTFHPVYQQLISNLVSDNEFVVKLTAVNEEEVFKKYVCQERLEIEKYFQWPKINFISHKELWDFADESTPYGGYYVCFVAKKKQLNTLLDDFWSRKISWLDYGGFTGIILRKEKLNIIPEALGIYDQIKQIHFILDNCDAMIDNVDYGYKMRITTENYNLDSLKEKICFQKISEKVSALELKYKKNSKYVGKEIASDGTLIKKKFI